MRTFYYDIVTAGNPLPPVGVEVIIRHAKIIDPEAFEIFETGDGAQRMSVLGAIERAVVKATQIGKDVARMIEESTK